MPKAYGTERHTTTMLYGPNLSGPAGYACQQEARLVTQKLPYVTVSQGRRIMKAGRTLLRGRDRWRTQPIGKAVHGSHPDKHHPP